MRALEAPGLAEDVRFTTLSARTQHLAALAVALNAILAEHDVATWLERLTHAGVPVTRVSGLEEAVVSEVASERGTFQACAEVPLVRLPWLVDGQVLPWARPAPRLGEHTVEILAELGYDPNQVATLVAEAAVGVPSVSIVR